MAYNATVIPIMIASPGDVSPERDAVREIIHDWNDVNSKNSKTVLTAVSWETHSSPELGNRPQALINSRVLKDCDLLVGIFWTRIGTPTGEAVSGTVEEIERHVKAGKPAMIYFSSQPVAPKSIDPEQFAAVLKFKETCMPMGLVESYDDLQQFKTKFAKDLPICLINNEYIKELVQKEAIPPSVEVSDDWPITQTVELSEESVKLLKAAATGGGSIHKMKYLGGAKIQAGKESFGTRAGREFAKWEAALSNLEDHGLIVARGYKGEMYELTHQGWSVADKL